MNRKIAADAERDAVAENGTSAERYEAPTPQANT